jgi:signal transduction histidine kinase
MDLGARGGGAARAHRIPLLAAFAAAVLAIVAVTTASLRSLAARREWTAAVTHSQDIRFAVERVLALATDAETAQRGFLLTGNEAYLQSFAGSEDALSQQLDALAGLIQDHPRQRENLAALRPLLQGKADALRRGVALRRQNDPAAFARVASGEAGAVMQRIRAQLAAMREQETSVLAERQRRLARADWWSSGIAVGGAALLLGLVLAAAVAVRGDLRRREEQARDRARVLEFQERLIAIVGHDLRNPLTAVLVSAQMLLQKKDELRPGQVSAVERILRSASRIDALAGLLIDFTYARLGKGIPTHGAAMDARAVVERAVDELRASHAGRQIRVDSSAPAVPGLWDADRVAQVVSNLVSNALQYGAREAPITVSVRSDPAGTLEIGVHNGGPALPEDVRRSLFEPYRRGKGAESAHPRGLGLGLFIVREIARAHGGTVGLCSDGQGTTFTVRLPQDSPPRPAAVSAEPAGLHAR